MDSRGGMWWKELPAPASLLAVVLLWEHPLALFGVLLALSAANITLFTDRGLAVRMWVAGVVLGPVAELCAIVSGAWTYTTPGFPSLVFPLWLSPLWGLASLFFTKRVLSYQRKHAP